jgi:magnesium transporter
VIILVKWFRRKVEKPGLSPGTLIKPEKEEKKVQPKITLIRYDESNCEMKEIKNLEDILPLKDKNEIIWINIDGVYDTKLLNKMGDSLHVHPLVLEDITNIDQRPKRRLSKLSVHCFKDDSL